jgi:hypothetical protein
MEFQWSKIDPRDVFSYNHDIHIVIIRPALSGKGLSGKRFTGFGEINTKHVYSIFTTFEDHRLIDADEKWDDTWQWILAPQVDK